MIFKSPIEFDWGKGNSNKNFHAHQVANNECEEIFFDRQKRVLKDILHSDKEERFVILGQTKKGRKLFIVFTIRKNKIRIISARDLNKKEKYLYEKN